MKPAVIFIINSLNNGGAERVCVNLAEEYYKEGNKVFFILIEGVKKDCAYKLDNGIEIISLNYNLNKKCSKIRSCIFGPHKINKTVKNIEREYDVKLITSHLPMSNIITRLSSASKKTLYVFHSTVKTFSTNTSVWFKAVFRWFLRGRKIVTVSEGIKNECVNEYGLDNKNISVIYNPIDLMQINKKKEEKNEKIKEYTPYFIIVGRLNYLKRHDRCIKIFEKGNFYKKYNLVICGTGELEQDLKEKAWSTECRNKIHFVGWQDNIYNWMNEAELLLCTSDREGFPMNIIEALSMNVKVVSSNCDFGPKEIMKGEYSKYLAKKDDINDYIDKINSALKKYPNSQNDTILECDVENVAKKYIEFYGV